MNLVGFRRLQRSVMALSDSSGSRSKADNGLSAIIDFLVEDVIDALQPPITSPIARYFAAHNSRLNFVYELDRPPEP
jgi:histidyl-tRNA synthetase